MPKKYIIIEKHGEKLMSRHIIWDLINVKANVTVLQYRNPKHTFEETIQSEINEIGNINSELNDESFLVDNFYEKILSRGFYARQLQLWYDMFPRDKILVISSEELATDTHRVLEEVFNFLEIPNVKIKDLTKQNVRKFPPMKQKTRELLIEYFKPYNEKLCELEFGLHLS